MHVVSERRQSVNKQYTVSVPFIDILEREEL